jgi:hypothetical protein
MKEILLTKGQVAFVDDADFEWLSQWKWTALERKYKGSGLYYAYRKKNKRPCYMHREILGLEYGDVSLVDHRDFNGLNNTRANIRTATPSQNAANTKPRPNRPHKYTGIVQLVTGKWGAQITREGTFRWLGVFKTQEEAAKAYDNARKAYFGEFAKLNFPDQKTA